MNNSALVCTQKSLAIHHSALPSSGCARLFGTALELAGQAGVAPAPTSGLRLPFGLGLPRLGGGGGGAGGADGVAGAGARLLLVWQLGAYLAASEAYHRAAARQLQGRAAFQETEMGTATVLLTVRGPWH